MQVGKTKDQGLYNKPSGAVQRGALAAGTLPQYNTMADARGTTFPGVRDGKNYHTLGEVP